MVPVSVCVQVMTKSVGDLPVCGVKHGQVPVVPPKGVLLVEEVVRRDGAHSQDQTRRRRRGPPAGPGGQQQQHQEGQGQAVL